jgi:hypothetical protein
MLLVRALPGNPRVTADTATAANPGVVDLAIWKMRPFIIVAR